MLLKMTVSQPLVCVSNSTFGNIITQVSEFKFSNKYRLTF